jgi:exodeoxyribonuclease VII large subunit
MGDPMPRARVFEVDDVVTALERVIGDHTRTVSIRGEVVNLRSGRDGRMLWFRLEDPRDGKDARVDCFAWSSDLVDGHVLADGALIQAVARPEFSRRDGSLIIRLRRIEPAGEGAMLRLIEERRRRLSDEGLFDAEAKRPLPFVPRGVGLVTAASGAARADVLRRIEARFPVPVVVVHAAMQGPACVREVIAGISALDAHPRVDVILIARGGGALQDLLPFSDEELVRAIRASGTPVVAGIGHEPDTTLACLAADARGATPTAAADLVVPDRAALAEDVAALGRRLQGAALRGAHRAGRELDLIGVRPGLLRPHDAVVRVPRARVRSLGARLGWAMQGAGSLHGRDLPVLRARMARAARAAWGARAGEVAALRARAMRAGTARSHGAGGRLGVLAARLAVGDPAAPIGRGFALVRDASGAAVTSAAAARAARDVRLSFDDGTVPATVREGEGDNG